MMRTVASLSACMLMLGCSWQQAQAAEAQAGPIKGPPVGAYIGCFAIRKLMQADRSLGIQIPRRFKSGPVRHCASHCRSLDYSLSIITPDHMCRCAIAVPDAVAQLDDAACGQAGDGAAVFYLHDLASTQSCRLAPLSLSADSVDFHYNSNHASFYKSNVTDVDTMEITMEGTNGIRLAPKDSWQLYGQVEVTAKVDAACGAVTAFYLRSSDEYSWDNKGDFDKIDFEFLNGHPAVKSCVWLNTFNGGMSGGEHMLRPHVYQAAVGLTPAHTTSNTFIKYTIHWQPSRVTWAMNGVPVLTRKSGKVVKWEDMMNKEFSKVFKSPDAASHILFSVWSDQSRYQFGGELAWQESPYHSYFHSLKRIVCEGPGPKPLPAALGWLLASAATPGNVGKSSNSGFVVAGKAVTGEAAAVVITIPIPATVATAAQQTGGKGGVTASKAAPVSVGKGQQPAAQGDMTGMEQIILQHGKSVATVELSASVSKDLKPRTVKQHSPSVTLKQKEAARTAATHKPVSSSKRKDGRAVTLTAKGRGKVQVQRGHKRSVQG